MSQGADNRPQDGRTEQRRWRVDVERLTGRAAEFHGRDIPLDDSIRLWWFRTTVDALVVGSSQPLDLVDEEVCRREGVDVVRRRSGGGLVLLTGSGTAWLDVVLPSSHPLWVDDVTASSFWLGEIWKEALETCGVGPLVQHRAGLQGSDLAASICFAGRGPGEVFLDGGEKVIGISQRRTRQYARFQCVLSLRWDPQRLLGLLREPRPDLDRLESLGSTLHVDVEAVEKSMTDLLVRRLSS